jgi:glycosyltransferase involved in cell wall biosynthesis
MRRLLGRLKPESMRHPRTILTVAYGLGGDGAVATRAVADIRGALDRGHIVTAVTNRSSADLPGAAVYEWGADRVLWRLPAGLFQAASLPFVWAALERAVRRARPEAIVFHESTLAWAVVPLARRLGARSCFVVHALIAAHRAQNVAPYDPSTMAIFKMSNRYALRHSDRVLCVSRYIAQLAESGGAPTTTIRVVPNPVDVDRFSADGAGPRDIDVLFVGRLNVEKGADVLVRAAALLPSPARVVIAGDGAERPRLEALAADLGVTITILGWVPKAELPALVGRAHIQVVPSRSEALPMVVVEALAAGTPVIASRVGGVPEMIVDGENGVLFEKDDVEGLRNAIAAALADRGRIDGMRPSARETAAQYAPATIARLMDAACLG